MKKTMQTTGWVAVALALCLCQSEATTVTLSGTNLVQDTYLRGDNNAGAPANNYGGSTSLFVGRITDGATYQNLGNTLLRFDMDSVSGQTVTNAVLRLYNTNHANQTADATISVFEVAAANGDWVEGAGLGTVVTGTSDWRFKIQNTGAWAGGQNGCSVAGTDYATPLVGSVLAVDTTAEWIEIALDAGVIQNWVDNPSQNYGIILTIPGALEGQAAYFNSTEAAVAGPELVLGTAPKTTETFSFGGTNQLEDVYLRGDNAQVSAVNNYGGSDLLTVGRLNADVVVNALMRFTDLSSLSGRAVSNATLRVYNSNHANQTNDVTIKVYEVAAANTDWIEGSGLGTVVSGTTDWRFKVQNTGAWAGGQNGCGVAGTDYTTNLVGSAVFADTAAEWVDIALDASVVQNWINNPGQNNGLLLTAPEAAVDGAIAYLRSSETTDGNGPELVVEVLLEKTYAQWAEANSLTGTNALASTDVEPDGMDNLLEYALGGNPNVDDASAVLPASSMVAESGTNWLEYVYNRRIDAAARGLGYGIILRTDLLFGAWTNIGHSAEIGTASVDADFESVTNRISTAENAKFVNLEVIEN